ncbi:hypothetical protein [uncultured Roseobacter sp.]|uniref:hypothetical protein n=1 Tax=uncultured Roseobacter sp. TaxID=114847 RepID=UPI0026178566|nr:hypothetical protein [uncultured Roseobacter sp.]
MAVQLHEILLRDIGQPTSLGPLFNDQQRNEMILERMQAERLLAACTLDNVGSLVDVLGAVLKRRSTTMPGAKNLDDELHVIYRAFRSELAYDEVDVVMASKDHEWEEF